MLKINNQRSNRQQMLGINNYRLTSPNRQLAFTHTEVTYFEICKRQGCASP